MTRPMRSANFSDLFLEWNSLEQSHTVHHQESSTVYTAMVYVILVLLVACWRDRDGTCLVVLLPDPASKQSTKPL